ncbi:MAG: response regulator [Leptolyngbyaceae cyanobacterium RU_5_1]|nr:response regulator [Leptolyngbyaceae cyanobacterium RU_5_1]
MTHIPVHILLLEDSPSDADLMRQVFVRSGKTAWNLVCTERLSQAIVRCQEQMFDVVLLDLNLPDSDGFETIATFREAVPSVPIVVLTTIDDDDLAMQAMAKGAQDYLVKGQITIQLLIRSVRYAIERGRFLERLKNSEQSILRSLEQEQDLDLLKSSFISMASHELRSPITMIRICTELLQNHQHELSAEKSSEYFDHMKAAIKQITGLLDEVLLLSSAESGGLRFKPVSEAVCK